MGGDYEAASEALQQGKPAATDRSRLTPLNHSFTLDFLIVVKSQRAGERVKASLTRFLQHHLKLEIKESKRTVGPTKEGVFLGVTFHGTRS
jgi:hypothetical protein